VLAGRPQLVCVAGGSGFGGRELVNRLVRARHSIRVLTRREPTRGKPGCQRGIRIGRSAANRERDSLCA